MIYEGFKYTPPFQNVSRFGKSRYIVLNDLQFGMEGVDGFIEKFSLTKCAKTSLVNVPSFSSIPLRQVTHTTLLMDVQ